MDNQYDCENPSAGNNDLESSREKSVAPLFKSTPPPSPKIGTKQVVSDHHDDDVNQDFRDKILREQKDFKNLRRYMRRDSTLSKIRRWQCCISLFFIVFVVMVIAMVMSSVFRHITPPKFSISTMAIHGMNVTSSALISPEFNVTLKLSYNPNSKIGARYYMESSSIDLYHSDLNLCNGVSSKMRKTSNNTLLFFDTTSKCEDILLSPADRMALENEEEQNKVAFGLKLKAPVKLVFGSIKTWKISLTVNCVATLNGLALHSNITSQNCNTRLRLS